MKLFLIRHGQTMANVEAKASGQMDVPLTDTGREQAESIRPILEQFRFDRVYSSDLSRAMETQRLAVPGVEGIRTPLLREIDVGSVGGMTFREIQEMLGGKKPASIPGQYANFGGESAQMVSVRLRKFLDMLEQDPCEYVAAFAHGGVQGIMLQTILEGDFDRTRAICQNCAIHVFEFVNGKWNLLAWNYMGKI